MSKITKDELLEILNTVNLDSILLFDLKGNLIESNDFKYDKNFAAMSGIITKMCTEMTAELQYGDLQKMLIQANKGLILLNKITDDYYIASFTSDVSKIGIVMKTIDALILNVSSRINNPN